jgi:serine protease Do
VSIQQITPELAKTFGLKQANGALVSDVVDGSPAEKAGVKQGDVIVEFNGKKVKSSSELPHIVGGTSVGKEVVMKIIRDGGEELALQVKVGELKDEQLAALAPSSTKSKLGIDIQQLTPELSRRFGIKDDRGVVVTAVEPDSPGEAAGLQSGDLILEINRSKVATVSQARRALEKTRPDEPTVVLVKREGNTRYVVIRSEG